MDCARAESQTRPRNHLDASKKSFASHFILNYTAIVRFNAASLPSAACAARRFRWDPSPKDNQKQATIRRSR